MLPVPGIIFSGGVGLTIEQSFEISETDALSERTAVKCPEHQ